jgi:hypothetical protein
MKRNYDDSKMAAFELQTPRERLRYFNTTDYPGLSAVQSAVQGPSPMKLTAPQAYEKGLYQRAVAQGNYNYIEKAKYLPLDQVPVDTESSLRKLDQGLLFRSLGPRYNSSPFIQPRVFGGYEPLPQGQFYEDPQGLNPTRGKSLDLY